MLALRRFDAAKEKPAQVSRARIVVKADQVNRLASGQGFRRRVGGVAESFDRLNYRLPFGLRYARRIVDHTRDRHGRNAGLPRHIGDRYGDPYFAARR